MILADTTIWIAFLKGSPDIFPVMKSLLENRKIIAVEWVFGELLQGVKNKREEKIIIEYFENTPNVTEAGMFIEAGKLSYQRKFYSKGVGIIDAALLIAARKSKAKIWTLDKKLLNLLKAEEKFTPANS